MKDSIEMKEKYKSLVKRLFEGEDISEEIGRTFKEDEEVGKEYFAKAFFDEIQYGNSCRLTVGNIKKICQTAEIELRCNNEIYCSSPRGLIFFGYRKRNKGLN
ncbi:MAG: hypothetical protein QXQ40_01575 [Candidatus Aenigmatarchaeota archaeon]